MTRNFGLIGKIFVLFIVVGVLGGCFAGEGSKWKKPPEIPPKPEPAGFWAGLWHGIIAVFAFVLELFTDVRIYEVNNNGGWYDFGFLLGLGAFSGGGIKIVHRKR